MLAQSFGMATFFHLICGKLCCYEMNQFELPLLDLLDTEWASSFMIIIGGRSIWKQYRAAASSRTGGVANNSCTVSFFTVTVTVDAFRFCAVCQVSRSFPASDDDISGDILTSPPRCKVIVILRPTASGLEC